MLRPRGAVKSRIDTATLISLLWICAEIIGARLLRSSAAERQDANSLRTLWITIILSIFAANMLILCTHLGHIHDPHQIYYWSGVTLMIAGLHLRFRAIRTLRKFFTMHVAIADDHELIRTGPYRRLRHPSYTGALLAFLGLALSMRNWLGLLVMMIPITLAFLRRIRIEETALRGKFGESYAQYCRETRALIPGII